nr:hypothetical protein Iba_chr01aCG13090 [Ipomoea batatas]
MIWPLPSRQTGNLYKLEECALSYCIVLHTLLFHIYLHLALQFASMHNNKPTSKGVAGDQCQFPVQWIAES